MKDSELLELYKAGVRDFCNVNMRNANLCKANLPGISLANAVLISADLSGADLSFANLSGADLSFANLFKADLFKADLSNADLSDADLSKADLSKACLFKAELHKTDLLGADLFEADLRGANLSEAGLSRASLNRANLNAVEESNCGVDYYSHSNLSGANLHNASLQEAQLSRADLSQVYLCKANLTRANLCRASLHSANLANAEVSGADLRHADLRDANLIGADLTNVNLEGAKLDGTILHKLEASCPPNIDWTMPLLAQQADFIQRLKLGHVLHCETKGQHSELTTISSEITEKLRYFCWQIAEKYKRNSPVRRVFINNMKGKLGEEVIKARLDNLITPVDYEKRSKGDNKIDFYLTSDPTIGIQVRARHSSIDSVEWSISQDEIKKNSVLVCILIQEQVNEAQLEYHLILAGFLPTPLIKSEKVGINQLLYGGALRSYLESLGSR